MTFKVSNIGRSPFYFDRSGLLTQRGVCMLFLLYFCGVRVFSVTLWLKGDIPPILQLERMVVEKRKTERKEMREKIGRLVEEKGGVRKCLLLLSFGCV